MGIPRLTSYLSPYAVITVLGCDKPACETHSPSVTNRSNRVIIDGPAFAYAIYNRLIAHQSDCLDALAAVPSYDEVGKAALAFLLECESYGVDIKKVYFDGFLPPQKTETRIARLEKQIETLWAFRLVHQHGFSSVLQAHKTDGTRISSILRSPRPTPNFQGLPVAPFFVAAVLEAIGNSKYASITEVVSGEADAYCAAEARQSGGTILSNDSDLLIHDLGPKAAVGSLSGLVVVAHDVAHSVSAEMNFLVVQTTVIKPREVAQSLGLKDLKNLAYVLIAQPGISFQKAIEQAQQTKLSGDQFQKTLGEYEIDPVAFKSCMFGQDVLNRIGTQTPFLDPRISEFVLQSDKQSASIYLPVMIEDPNRTPAFAVSISQRRFAYSCCTLPYKGRDREFFEYGRKAQKIFSTSIESLSRVEILAHAKNLRTRLQHFKTTFSAFLLPLIWRTYALAEVYHWYLDTSRAPPSRDAMTTAITGKVQGRITWNDVHLCAQIEASLYSLRMIQQILEFVVPCAPSDETEVISEILLGLKEDLKDLPPLKHLMPSRRELLAQTANADIDEVLYRLASTLQDDIRQEASADSE